MSEHHCERIEHFIRSLGYSVEMLDTAELNRLTGEDETWTDGATNYRTRRVLIHSVPRVVNNYRKFMMTMLHEAGHAFSHRHCHGRGEYNAFKWGWEIRQRLQIPVTMTQWREFNWEAFA